MLLKIVVELTLKIWDERVMNTTELLNIITIGDNVLRYWMKNNHLFKIDNCTT